MSDFSGQVIKGYELKERIGTGGFGAVYKAHQSTVGREVAMKIILPHFANHPDFIRRFETEAQMIARLEHLHITPLYDYWRDPNGAYLVMRWLRGGSLRDALQNGPYHLETAARLVDQIASALAAAHTSGIIHRDLKPGNILLDEDGNAYLADFGIAKDLNLMQGTTEVDVIVGSPDYLSPEQARSEPVTPRTDVYSFGVVLYEMLVGQHPFPGLSSVERLYKHLSDPLPYVDTLEPDVREGVNAVIQKATAKNPAHRFADALELAQAFRKAIASHNTAGTVVEILTQREQEILGFIIDGRSNKEIAEKLYITLTTVKWYITQIYRKLGVRSRVQAIVRARELNLITPGRNSSPSLTIIPTDQFQPTNPYKGLRAFQSADNREFFGRESLVEKLVKRLGEARFLAVIGPSGSGKSSLVKAGLIPALWRGEIPGSEKWFVAEMLPGSYPLDELEVALLRVAANQSGNLKEQLERDERGLLRVAQLILPDDGSDLILVIDQFEEVFTLVEDEAARLHFLSLLQTAVTESRSRVRVVITLRADFYDRPLHYPEFGELVRSKMETVLPLGANSLERAIIKPAEQQDVKFEEGLVASIISEVNYQPGALPLLQYALTELFEHRQGHLLTHEAYHDIGGTISALAKRADEIFEGLNDAGKEAVRQMFLRLVTLGEGVEDTRRRVARSELMAIAADEDLMDDIIDTYAEYRLLSLDNDPGTRAPTVEVAHEAILREWERLRNWLNDNRDEIRLQRQLANMAEEWRESKQDMSFLARGSRLEQFEKWGAGTQLALTAAERLFLNRSIAEREQQVTAEQERQVREKRLERRSQTFLRGLVAVLLLATLGAFGLTGIAVNNANLAQANATLATARELAAASVNTLTVDPQLSLLLALRAVKTTYDIDGTWTQQAEEALHRAVGTAQALQVLHGHTGTLNDVVYSPDGTRVASASLDGTAKIWDAATGQELLTLNQSAITDEITGEDLPDDEVGYGVYSLAYSPDGTRLATGNRDGVIAVWDAINGTVLFTIHETPFVVTSLSFSPDGMRLALTAVDMWGSSLMWEVRVWELTTREVIFTLSSTAMSLDNDFGPPIGDVAFSRDGKLLATAIAEKATVWDLNTRSELLTLIGHTRWINDLDFSPDGRQLATVSGDRTIRIWDIATPLSLGIKTSREVFNLPGAFGLAFSPDGTRLVAATDEGAINVWNPATGIRMFTLSGHTGSVRSIAFSPDGTRIVTGGTDKTVRLWNAKPGQELFTLSFDPGFTFRYSPDGTRLAISTATDTTKIWDAFTGEELMSLTPAGGSVAFSPDGTRLVTAFNGNANMWDVVKGELLFTAPAHGENLLDGVDYTLDGKLVAAGSQGPEVIVWDAVTGQELFTLTGGHTRGSVHCVVFSPDGKYLASGGDDHIVVVWDLATRQPLFVVPTQGDVAVDLAFSPDGKRLATASYSEAIDIWDAVTGETLLTLAGHPGSIWGVRFSPDGKVLATTGGVITKLRDSKTGQDLLTLYGHSSAVYYVEFSPDGKRLATMASDYSVRSYVLSMDDLLPLAVSRVTRSWTLEECQRYLHTERCPAGL